MLYLKLYNRLTFRDASITPEQIFENSRADSGGERELNFLKFLLDNEYFICREALLKRTTIGISEDLYLDKYKRLSLETGRHFLCRSILQEEFAKMAIGSLGGTSVGNMDILRENGCYDIVFEDFSVIMDIGLTPARNFYRGLTDLKVKSFIVTGYFDDYMDDIIFSIFERNGDEKFLDAVKDFVDGYSINIGAITEEIAEQRYGEAFMSIDDKI